MIQHDILIAFGAIFVAKVVEKAIIEPIATQTGRQLLEAILPPVLEMLDEAVDDLGLDLDPEALVRTYLDLEVAEGLSEDEIEDLADAIFEIWDLREAAAKARGNMG